MDIQKIKAVMKEKKITQQQLSNISGVPLQTIRKIFAGVTKHPRVDTLQAIEKALGITEETITLNENEIKLINTIRKLPQNKQDLAISTFCNSLELLNND